MKLQTVNTSLAKELRRKEYCLTLNTLVHCLRRKSRTEGCIGSTAWFTFINQASFSYHRMLSQHGRGGRQFSVPPNTPRPVNLGLLFLLTCPGLSPFITSGLLVTSRLLFLLTRPCLSPWRQVHEAPDSQHLAFFLKNTHINT